MEERGRERRRRKERVREKMIEDKGVVHTVQSKSKNTSTFSNRYSD